MQRTSSFIQIADYLLNVDCLACINLSQPREATAHGPGGGTVVRVWFDQRANPAVGAIGAALGANLGGANSQMPAYLDFTGQQAQQIRRYFAKAADTGFITTVVEGGVEEEPTSKTRAAAKA